MVLYGYSVCGCCCIIMMTAAKELAGLVGSKAIILFIHAYMSSLTV